MNVRKLKIFFIIGVLLMAWLTGWGFRKEITVQDTNVDGNLTDFPVYIDITVDEDIGDEALANGHDIRFTESDGETLLKYEREYWVGGDGADATGHFWIKVPSILASGGAIIYCYYGKADAGDGEDAANVWDANFKMVHHMEGASALALDDSTSNNVDITGDAGTPDYNQAGKIGRAVNFVKTDSEYLTLGNALDMANWTGMTLRAWINYDSSGSNEHTIFSNWNSTVAGVLFRIEPSNDQIEAYVRLEPNTQVGRAFTDQTVPVDTWAFVVLTYSPSTELQSWIDDSKSSESQGSDANFDADASGNACIGTSPHAGAAAIDSLDGLIDEVRMCNTVRADAWIKFEYHNINESDNELGWGVEETSIGEYSLIVDAGSFTFMGQSTNLLKSSLIDIEVGSFVETGLAAGLFRNYEFPIGVGSFIETGLAATLLKSSLIAVVAGSYVETGQVANLLKSILFDIGAGSYVETGQIVNLLKSSLIGIGMGTYIETGQIANLLKSIIMSAVGDSFVLIGQAAGLFRNYEFPIGEDSFILTGQVANLLKSNVIGVRADAYVLTGMAVGLDYSTLIIPIIFDVFPRKRTWELEIRERIPNVSPRARIFDRRST